MMTQDTNKDRIISLWGKSKMEIIKMMGLFLGVGCFPIALICVLYLQLSCHFPFSRE